MGASTCRPSSIAAAARRRRARARVARRACSVAAAWERSSAEKNPRAVRWVRRTPISRSSRARALDFARASLRDVHLDASAPPRGVSRVVTPRGGRRSPSTRAIFQPLASANSPSFPPRPRLSPRYLSRFSPQAPCHRWQAEALAQEAEVRTPPCRDFPRSRRALKPANGRRCSPCDLGFFLLETIAHRPLPSLSSIPSLQVRVGPPVRQHQALFLGLRPHRAMPRRQQEVPRDPSRLW